MKDILEAVLDEYLKEHGEGIPVPDFYICSLIYSSNKLFDFGKQFESFLIDHTDIVMYSDGRIVSIIYHEYFDQYRFEDYDDSNYIQYNIILRIEWLIHQIELLS